MRYSGIFVTGRGSDNFLGWKFSGGLFWDVPILVGTFEVSYAMQNDLFVSLDFCLCKV